MSIYKLRCIVKKLDVTKRENLTEVRWKGLQDKSINPGTSVPIYNIVMRFISTNFENSSLSFSQEIIR